MLSSGHIAIGSDGTRVGQIYECAGLRGGEARFFARARAHMLTPVRMPKIGATWPQKQVLPVINFEILTVLVFHVAALLGATMGKALKTLMYRNL